MQQFVSHGERDKGMVKQFSKDFPVIDQNQIMERTSVGDDDAAHLFGHAPEGFKI